MIETPVSRAEWEQALRLIEVLSMRVNVQSQTIDALAARIDQQQRATQHLDRLLTHLWRMTGRLYLRVRATE